MFLSLENVFIMIVACKFMIKNMGSIFQSLPALSPLMLSSISSKNQKNSEKICTIKVYSLVPRLTIYQFFGLVTKLISLILISPSIM